MPQLNHEFTDGQIGTPGNGAYIVTVPNPTALGTSEIDVNGVTTDADYTIGLYQGPELLATAVFPAVSKSAAQIAAGLTAAALAEPTFSGYLKSMTVHDTDHTTAVFLDPSMNLSIAALVGVLVITNTAPAPKTVTLCEILQADGTGGWTQTYTDAALGLGVVCRSGEYALGYDGVDLGGPTSPGPLSVVKSGPINVPVPAGVTVYRGNKVAYSPTTKLWQTTVTGTYVLVEQAQWQTTGTGVQKVSVNFPSEN